MLPAAGPSAVQGRGVVEERRMRRTIQVGLSMLAVVVLFAGAIGTASAHPSGTTYLKVKAAHGGKPNRGNNLSYHGGAIESAVKVYIVWWGPQWSGSGFSTGGYSSGQAQTYLGDFFANLRGRPRAHPPAPDRHGGAARTDPR